MNKSAPKPATPGILTSTIAFVKKHAVVISVALFALLAGYILLLTNQLTTRIPDQTSVDTELSSVSRPKIEKTVVETILGLEDRNVEVKSIFQEARDNPFSE